MNGRAAAKKLEGPSVDVYEKKLNSRLGLCSVVIVDSYEEIFCDRGGGMKERVPVRSPQRGRRHKNARKKENQLNQNNFDIVHFDAQRNYRDRITRQAGITHVTQL
jgi:hypothetical protein